jgi:hypothetical protein
VGGALQLAQPAHPGMVLGQPVAQHQDRLGARVDAGRSQGGGDRGDVAGNLPPDLGLADRLGELGGVLGRRSGLAGRTGKQPELVAGLLQGEQTGAGVAAGRRRDMWQMVQLR